MEGGKSLVQATKKGMYPYDWYVYLRFALTHIYLQVINSLINARVRVLGYEAHYCRDIRCIVLAPRASRRQNERQPWQLKFRTHIPRLGKRKALNI